MYDPHQKPPKVLDARKGLTKGSLVFNKSALSVCHASKGQKFCNFSPKQWIACIYETFFKMDIIKEGFVMLKDLHEFGKLCFLRFFSYSLQVQSYSTGSPILYKFRIMTFSTAEKEEDFFTNKLFETSSALDNLHGQMKSLSVKLESSEETIRNREKQLEEHAVSKETVDKQLRDEHCKVLSLTDEKDKLIKNFEEAVASNNTNIESLTSKLSELQLELTSKEDNFNNMKGLYEGKEKENIDLIATNKNLSEHLDNTIQEKHSLEIFVKMLTLNLADLDRQSAVRLRLQMVLEGVDEFGHNLSFLIKTREPFTRIALVSHADHQHVHPFTSHVPCSKFQHSTMLLRFPLHADSPCTPIPSLYLPSRFQMEMRLVSIPSQFHLRHTQVWFRSFLHPLFFLPQHRYHVAFRSLTLTHGLNGTTDFEFRRRVEIDFDFRAELVPISNEADSNIGFSTRFWHPITYGEWILRLCWDKNQYTTYYMYDPHQKPPKVLDARKGLTKGSLVFNKSALSVCHASKGQKFCNFSPKQWIACIYETFFKMDIIKEGFVMLKDLHEFGKLCFLRFFSYSLQVQSYSTGSPILYKFRIMTFSTAEKEEDFFTNKLFETSSALDNLHGQMKSLSVKLESSEETIRNREKQLEEHAVSKETVDKQLRDEHCKVLSLTDEKDKLIKNFEEAVASNNTNIESLTSKLSELQLELTSKEDNFNNMKGLYEGKEKENIDLIATNKNLSEHLDNTIQEKHSLEIFVKMLTLNLADLDRQSAETVLVMNMGTGLNRFWNQIQKLSRIEIGSMVRLRLQMVLEGVDEFGHNLKYSHKLLDFLSSFPESNTDPVLQIVGAHLLPFTPIPVRSESRPETINSFLAVLTNTYAHTSIC
ncbi:hypothetical protein LXL04_013433 [Taraxacum kok-saghyz]